MAETAARPHAQITFLYYNDLREAAGFYEDILGLECVQDQGMAKIYRVARDSYVGIVDGARGHFRAQDHNAVLVTIVVDDEAQVRGWHARCAEKGVKNLTDVRQGKHAISFFGEDPGGYGLEVQCFRDPAVARLFQL